MLCLCLILLLSPGPASYQLCPPMVTLSCHILVCSFLCLDLCVTHLSWVLVSIFYSCLPLPLSLVLGYLSVLLFIPSTFILLGSWGLCKKGEEERGEIKIWIQFNNSGQLDLPLLTALMDSATCWTLLYHFLRVKESNGWIHRNIIHWISDNSSSMSLKIVEWKIIAWKKYLGFVFFET